MDYSCRMQEIVLWNDCGTATKRPFFKSRAMKTCIAISSLLVFICIGCSREVTVKQASIDLDHVPSIELKAQSYPLDSALWAPDCIFTQGDYLIIEEGKRHTGIFRCFDAKNFDFLFACGTKGKGPNKVMHLLGQYILPCDSGFCVMDNGTEKEFQIKDGHLQVVCQSPIAIYDAVNGLAKIGDNHFFMNGYTDGSGAEHLIYKDGQITECGTYPESPYDDQQRFIMEFKTNVAQIGGDTIYSFYNNRNLIRKYSPQGELLEEMHFLSYPTDGPDYESYRAGTCQQFTGRSYQTKSFFFLSFYDGMSNQQVFSGNYTPQILVWDWKNGLRYRIVLQRQYKRLAYAISEKHKRLYAIDLDAPDRIDYYDLDSIF